MRQSVPGYEVQEHTLSKVKFYFKRATAEVRLCSMSQAAPSYVQQ